MIPAGPGPGIPALPLCDVDLAIFDKDGTLIDFEAMWSGWAGSLADRLEAIVGAPIREPLYAAIGFDPGSGRAVPGGPLAIKPMADLRRLAVRAVGSFVDGRHEAERAVGRAWETPDPVALARQLGDLETLFMGFHERGVLVAVATSDDRAPTQATLAALGVGRLVDALACADDGLPVKPSPAMVLHLCRTLAVHPGRTAMIGDTAADLAMGRAAGVGLCVGVLSGVGTRGDLGPIADLVIPSIADLLDP